MTVTRPIFIVGGPRSGKKMVSEVLAHHPQISAFPCEMTFLWRYCHGASTYDSLAAETMTPKIAAYLQREFAKVSRPSAPRVVDRTDHNVVRLEYVREAFPDCLILHLIRDGRGSVASAMRRRRSNPGWKYLVRKATSIPVSDLPSVGASYGWDVLQSRLGRNRYRKLWGIRTPVTQRYEAEPSLAVKCAVQWRECVALGLASQANFTDDNYMILRYEETTTNPVDVFRRVFEFADLSWSYSTENWLRNNIHSGSLELWKKHLTEEMLLEIEPHIRLQMQQLGYLKAEMSEDSHNYSLQRAA